MSTKALKDMLERSDNIVFFGGAGVSTESNIPDFRSAKGLYNEAFKASFSPEQILSHSFFMRYPKDFYDFYRSKMVYRNAEPNYAHIALAKLEAMGKLKAVITQNIDGLHQKAGSKKVLELHGSVYRNYCMDCGKFFDIDYILDSEYIPKCDKCSGTIKPDVVLYEEGLNMEVLQEAIDLISRAQVLIIGGTSLSVYPAANLVNYYKGDRLVLINKASTPYDNRADLIIKDSIGEVFRSIV